MLISSYNGYSTVSVGEVHACTMQILGSYRVVDCWGDNHYGQIGIDQAAMAYGPFTVRAQFGESVSRVSTQRNVTCVDQTSGIVQCVGDNSFQEIGLPSGVWGSGIPQNIGGGQQLHDVSASVFHVCALDASNGAWCWGMGFFGQLGNGQHPNAQQTPVQVTGARAYRAIATGYQHTCAIGTDNHIYCWGYNDFGQLGAGILNSWVSNPVQALDP
jgi:alpha-tubulin suppressor-like RCC1 family protein